MLQFVWHTAYNGLLNKPFASQHGMFRMSDWHTCNVELQGADCECAAA